MVKVYTPTVRLTLRKNIGRKTVGADIAASERFQGAEREIDLTPYLGVDGSVTVTKSVRQSAGAFSVVLTDRMEPEQQESLYGLIEPLDVLEIRMARDASLYDDGPPIMMRGIVAEVARDRAMTEAGPRRAVIVSGNDYGRVLELMRIIYQYGAVLGQELLSAYRLAINYGVDLKADEPIGDFFRRIVDLMINPFVEKMAGAATGGSPDIASPLAKLATDITVTGGIVAAFGAQEWPGGTVGDLLRYFGDVGAWNELYVEDRKDGPTLVFRPAPFRNLKGEFIQGAAEAVVVREAEITSERVSRTDSDVVNFVWVDAPRFNLLSASTMQNAALAGQLQPAPFVTDYANNSPELYGVRPLEVQTQQGDRIDGQSAPVIAQGYVSGLALLNEKRRVLIEANRDNVVLETGSLQMRGDEHVKAGVYLSIQRGADGSGPVTEAYAHSVTHQFVWGRAYTTSVEYDRGTGFVSRLQRGRGVDSPYLSEISLRGAYG